MADFVATVVQEGGRIIRERVARYGIACDLKDGNLFTAFSAKQMRELEDKQALWRRHGHDTFEMLDRDGVRRHVASDRYAGGMLDRSGGHMHPLNLALGQAAALEGLGGVIHEASPVVAIDDVGRPAGGADGEGRGAARAADPGRQRLSRARGARAGEPGDAVLDADHRHGAAGARGAALLPTDVCVEDVRYVLDYYRLSADRRLLFGGGTVYGGTDPADIRAKLVPNMERVFPQLSGVRRGLRLVGELRHLVQPGAADGAAGRAELLRAGLQRARGGREPSLRANPGGSGGRRPVAV